MWELVDATDNMGVIPSRQLRESLSEGNFARVWFTLDGVIEALWLLVHERREVGRKVGYLGEICTAPRLLAGDLRNGEYIEFEPRHVAAWEPG